MNTREKGNIGEDKAVEFLIKNNYQIVTRNFYSRFGEIDIIAKKGEVLHFIEVKSGDNFQPIYNVTYSKLQKIIKTLSDNFNNIKIFSNFSGNPSGDNVNDGVKTFNENKSYRD